MTGNDTTIILNKKDDMVYNEKYNCLFHSNLKFKSKYVLKFLDWRQFIEFFELKKEDIPIEMVQYLNQNSTLYTGNSILCDTDPLDDVESKWFSPYDSFYNSSSNPIYSIIFYICGHCERKILKQIEKEKNKTPILK